AHRARRELHALGHLLGRRARDEAAEDLLLPRRQVVVVIVAPGRDGELPHQPEHTDDLPVAIEQRRRAHVDPPQLPLRVAHRGQDVCRGRGEQLPRDALTHRSRSSGATTLQMNLPRVSPNISIAARFRPRIRPWASTRYAGKLTASNAALRSPPSALACSTNDGRSVRTSL